MRIIFIDMSLYIIENIELQLRHSILNYSYLAFFTYVS